MYLGFCDSCCPAATVKHACISDDVTCSLCANAGRPLWIVRCDDPAVRLLEPPDHLRFLPDDYEPKALPKLTAQTTADILSAANMKLGPPSNTCIAHPGLFELITWIPTAERLPVPPEGTLSVRILALARDQVIIAIYDGDGWWVPYTYPDFDSEPIPDVTHWAELPKGPRS